MICVEVTAFCDLQIHLVTLCKSVRKLWSCKLERKLWRSYQIAYFCLWDSRRSDNTANIPTQWQETCTRWTKNPQVWYCKVLYGQLTGKPCPFSSFVIQNLDKNYDIQALRDTFCLWLKIGPLTNFGLLFPVACLIYLPFQVFGEVNID